MSQCFVQALKQEISYASHVHIPYLILPSPRNPEYVTDYARAINAALAASPFIHVRLASPNSCQMQAEQGQTPTSLQSDFLYPTPCQPEPL